MAEADTLAYYGKLATLRGAQPVVGATPYSVRQCNAGDLTGDAIYTYRCPAAWLEFMGVPSASSAQLVFPRDYFAWVKQYLQQALANRPSATASAEFRVVWALDVWAHVNFAYMAFPLPWSDIFSGGITAVPQIALPLASFVTGPRSITSGIDAAWAAAKTDAEKNASTTAIRNAIVTSRLNPAPFSEVAVQWCGAPGARSPLFQRPNPIWPLLLAACQPWSAAWANNWLGSRGSKDSADVKRWAMEPALLRATMQWRLMSIQDWGYAGPDPSYWPMGMGTANAVVLLSTYIASVKSEYTAPRIAFYGTQAYPNLAFGLASVTTLAQQILGLNYDVVLQKHLDVWLSQSAPKLAGAAFATNSDGTTARQPITRTDYADYFKGLRQAVTDRTRLALANPALNCAPGDAQCLKATEYGVKIQTAIQSSPLAPVQNAMMRVADKLVVLIGAAIGGGYEPLFVVRDPFCRSFSAPGYRWEADGSTADLFYRIGVAVAQYRGLLPGLFTATIPATTRVAKANCTVYWDRNGNACEICDGQPRPPCAANVANLPPPQAAATTVVPAEVAAFCAADWAKFHAASPYRYVLDEQDRLMHLQICTAMRNGMWSLVAGGNAWKGYLQNRHGAPPKSNLFAAFKAGFLRSSNPIR